MVKQFKGLDQFAHHLEWVSHQYQVKEKQALEFIGAHLREVAKEEVGHLQEGGGPFKPWKELEESTIADKERKGYAFNADFNPLLRTGELRDSIEFKVIGQSVHMGSDSDVMFWQEFGTTYISPRSVIGLAMFKEHRQIKSALRQFIVHWVASLPEPYTAMRFNLKREFF